jgi:hypothetical protein
VRSGAARLITRAYRRHVEHTPWNEATRSGSPSMVIMTTPTCWPSAAATHSTHMVSSGSLSNVMMISRTSCKAQSRCARVLIQCQRGQHARGLMFQRVGVKRSTSVGHHVRLVAGRPQVFCPVSRYLIETGRRGRGRRLRNAETGE